MQRSSLPSLQLDPRERIAVFAFSESRQLLYLNELAHALPQENVLTDTSTHGPVPSQVLSFAEKLQRPTHATLTRPAYLQEEIRHAGCSWQLQGFLIPTDPLTCANLILVLMEPLGAVKARCDRLSFTPRESEIARLVARGLTNKQIASELRVAEQTVKDHMKHIMIKTETSTRTALVAYLFAEADQTAAERFPESRFENELNAH